MATRCFWVEPTGFERVSLRRYVSGSECPVHGIHDASTFVCDRGGHSATHHVEPEHATEIAYEHGIDWPAACECGYHFAPEDTRQVFTVALFERMDTGERKPLRDWEPGAMWNADWLPEAWHGPDGRSICVKLPNGDEWLIDSRASNCGLPDDNEHQCWVRHGEPPNLTVDKNGNTCAAGGGSIWSRQGKPNEWHGFLRDGVLDV